MCVCCVCNLLLRAVWILIISSHTRSHAIDICSVCDLLCMHGAATCSMMAARTHLVRSRSIGVARVHVRTSKIHHITACQKEVLLPRPAALTHAPRPWRLRRSEEAHRRGSSGDDGGVDTAGDAGGGEVEEEEDAGARPPGAAAVQQGGGAYG